MKSTKIRFRPCCVNLRGGGGVGNLVLAACMALISSMAFVDAGTVYKQTKNNTDWNSCAWTEIGTNAQTFDQYVFLEGPTGNYWLRSPERNPTFFSDSALYLGHTYANDTISVGGVGAVLLLKSTPVTVGTIYLGNGKIDVGNNNAEYSISGSIIVDGVGTFSSNGVGTSRDSRCLRVDSSISGTGSLEIISTASSTSSRVVVASANNTFSGAWNLSAATSRLLVTGANGLGSGSSVTNAGVLTLQANQTLTALTNTGQIAIEDCVLTSGNITVSYKMNANTQTLALPNQTVSATDSKSIRDAYAAVGITFTGTDSGLAITGSREAATFTRTGTTADWTTNWLIDGSTTALIPTIGDVVRIDNGVDLRTPEREAPSGGDHFLAETWMNTGSRLILKTWGGGVYMPNLVMNGGKLWIGVGTGRIVSLYGNILVQNDTMNTLNLDTTNASDTRKLNLYSTMTGSGDWVFICGERGTATAVLAADNSGWSGTLTLQDDTNLQTTVASALGTGTLVLQETSDAVLGGAQSISGLRFEGTNNTLTVNGSLSVPTITRTNGSNMPIITLGNSGSLAFTTLGDAANPIDLNQTAGTVSLLGSTGSISGDYTQTGGKLVMLLGTQTLSVEGDFTLQNLELDTAEGFVFDPQRLYEVFELPETGGYDFSSLNLTLIGGLHGLDIIVRQGGDMLYAGTRGAVENGLPEPSTWLLLGLSFLCAWRKVRR